MEWVFQILRQIDLLTENEFFWRLSDSMRQIKQILNTFE